MPQKTIPKVNLTINNTLIDQVENFNFLGLTLDAGISWKPHVNKIAGKIIRTIGILNKVKHSLPIETKLIIYSSLLLPHLNYNLLLWGHCASKIQTLQKKAIRIICCAKYNSHTDPLFKALNLLKLEDLYNSVKLKLYHKQQMTNNTIL